MRRDRKQHEEYMYNKIKIKIKKMYAFKQASVVCTINRKPLSIRGIFEIFMETVNFSALDMNNYYDIVV